MEDMTAGVPISEVLAKDFIMVRAALVKRLGGANEAIVWSRVHYRCDEDSRVAHDTDSGRWWAATYDVVGAETGLSAKQARGALERLIAGGYLRAEQHRLRSNYDQTYSYQPVVLSGQIDLPSGADERAREGDSGLPSGADVPSIETVETRKTSTVQIDAVEDAFERIWQLWPSHRRVTRKKSGSSFRTAVTAVGGVRNVSLILDAAAEHAAVWMTWPQADMQFVPSMTTWLNQERWTMQAPTPRSGKLTTVDTGRAAAEILKARDDAGRMAVSA